MDASRLLPRIAITPENATEVIGKVMMPDVYPITVDLARSQGNRIFDSRGQRFYLDCFSYIASNPVGHNHPKLFEAEFERKLLRAARSKPSSSDFHTVELAEFVDAFRRLAMPPSFNHLFLVEGGAVAVENGMKVAFDWKVRKNFARNGMSAGSGGAERGTQIIHFEQAFHGRCGYTLSVTNTADPRKTKFFPKFPWPRITNPKLRFPLTEAVLKEIIEAEQHAVAAIERACIDHEGDIAAILIEPIQAEGGDNHFRPEFHQALRRLADTHGTMLIYDEVQTGVGLTGRMWAYEHYGVTPDIVCFGKKMQVCGIMVGPRVEEVENHVFKEASRINSTWGGNLCDMVRAQRFLEIIHEDGLVANAAAVGALFLTELEKLCQEYPDTLSNARGKGLMCAVDVNGIDLRDTIMKELFCRGAIVLKCGINSLRFRPSLTFTPADVAELMGMLDETVRALRP